MMLNDPFFNGTFDVSSQINKQFWSTPFFARNQAMLDRRIAKMERKLSVLKQQKYFNMFLFELNKKKMQPNQCNPFFLINN